MLLELQVLNIKDCDDGLFNEFLKRNHIICISETWRDPKDNIKFMQNVEKNLAHLKTCFVSFVSSEVVLKSEA